MGRKIEENEVIKATEHVAAPLTLGLKKVRTNLSYYLDLAHETGEPIVITNNGVAIMVIDPDPAQGSLPSIYIGVRKAKDALSDVGDLVRIFGVPFRFEKSKSRTPIWLRRPDGYEFPLKDELTAIRVILGDEAFKQAVENLNGRLDEHDAETMKKFDELKFGMKRMRDGHSPFTPDATISRPHLPL